MKCPRDVILYYTLISFRGKTIRKQTLFCTLNVHETWLLSLVTKNDERTCPRSPAVLECTTRGHEAANCHVLSLVAVPVTAARAHSHQRAPLPLLASGLWRSLYSGLYVTTATLLFLGEGRKSSSSLRLNYPKPNFFIFFFLNDVSFWSHFEDKICRSVVFLSTSASQRPIVFLRKKMLMAWLGCQFSRTNL